MESVQSQITMEVAESAARSEEATSDGTEEPQSQPVAKQDATWLEDFTVQEWIPSKEAKPEKWQMGDLEEALPQPIIYHELLWRDWQDLYDSVTPSIQQFDFTVLTYNLLSQDLVDQNPELYQHCSPSILQWEYRWPNILQELQHWEADILCLQEVQEDHYREQVQPGLTALGYSCHYKRRTGRKTDGCCTSFKAHRFTLLSESHVEFFRPGIEVLNRDNVGLILLLQPLLTEDIQDGCPPPLLCVANTHLLYNPRRGDIKLAQLALLLAEVDKLSSSPNGSRCPIILCGDLNSTPNSPLYQLLYNGVLNYSGLPAWKVSGQEEYCTTPHPRTLPSPLWPDILGINQHCQYVTQRAPRVKDRRTYTRECLWKLRYCDCALQRPKHLVLIKGVTDNKPDPLAGTDHNFQAGNFLSSGGAFLRTPLLLQHNLNLTSAYNHFLPAKSRPEVTTIPFGVGSTVDYIFYSAEPLPICSTDHGLRFYQDSQLKLLGRLCLLCEDDLWAAQGLPNPFCSSDHLCLLARFSLDLSAP
ncbi:protein angel homolog 1 [Mixophyes fleayi]|uniref:protein angel homolog 1 n=1 Tax=Mixophyes fleayi TaxID=3061075 RepID=UPI003F4DEFA7